MFWTAIVNGLELLLHWQIWVAFLIYTLGTLGFILSGALLAGDDEGGRGVAVGCLYLIGGVVVVAVLTGVLIAWLMPLLLGQQRPLPLGDLALCFWTVARVSLLVVVAVGILSVVPVIEPLLVYVPGVCQYVIAVLIFHGVLQDFLIMLNLPHSGATPGFWIAVAFGIIAAAINLALMLGAISLANRTRSSYTRRLLSAAGMWVGCVGGLLPFFMYTQYVRLALGLP